MPYENGFYIELGANDGINQSNTYYFEKYKNWKGVLIEPIPHQFIACNQNRSLKNTIVCNACVSSEFNETFVEIAYSNLMSTAIGIESDVKNPSEHALRGKEFIKNQPIFTFGAMAKTLTRILDENKAPKIIDFLSLDVEGVELEVLKGLDLNKYQLKYMCIELRNFEIVEDYLQNFGYSLVEKLSPLDYLFKNSRLA